MDGIYTMASNRRAGRIFGLGNSVYDLLAWNDRVAAGAGATTPKGASPQISSHAIVSSDGRQLVAQVKLEGRGRVVALAIAEDVAVYSYRNSEMALTTVTNTLNLVSLESGKVIQQLPLTVSTTYDGLAIAGGKVFVSLSDGRLVCLGE
jgi:hypothetical protein